jgi:hypothetical protein
MGGIIFNIQILKMGVIYVKFKFKYKRAGLFKIQIENICLLNTHLQMHTTQLTHNSHITHTQLIHNSHITPTTMSHNTSPNNKSAYHIPPEYLFPIFPNENEPQNTLPEDLFPVFPYENQPQNTPPEVLFPPANNQPTNNPPVEYQPNPFRLTDEQLRQLDQDEENFIEIQQDEAREEAARRERERRASEYTWEMGLGPEQLETSSEEEGWVSDDPFY